MKHTPMHLARRPTFVVGGGPIIRPSGLTPPLKHTTINKPSTAENTYRPGDGETQHTVRPGSMDAYKLPSRGFRT